MKQAALALIVLCGMALLKASAASPGLPTAPSFPSGAEPIVEDVPVPGGVSALADLVQVAPVPDRARFIAELARIIYSSPSSGPYSNEPIRRRIDAFFADARQRAIGTGGEARTDEVPVPLSANLWSQLILHRPVDRRNLVGAILTDRTAALMCYSLAGLDDQTLQFFADHPAVLSRLAERAPAAFGAFGESLHVRDGRLSPPGGDAAAFLWEAAVGETLNRPERFISLLFESDRGRMAYLYDVLSHLDAATLAFALDASIAEPDERVSRFRRLANVAKRGFVEWDVTTAPFARPPNALGAFFGRVRVEANGTARVATPALWPRAFDESGLSNLSSPSGPSSPSSSSSSSGTPRETPTAARAGAATLAELILSHPARERERRLEAFSFAQRVFTSPSEETGKAGTPGRAGSAGTGAAGTVRMSAADADEMVAAVRGFSSFPVLMLALERMGIRTPSTYVAAAQQAERLTALDATRGPVALSQFQGAVALLSRMVLVRTIDTATAERLARDLFGVRVNDAGRYNGGIAAWMNDRLRAALPAGRGIDDMLLAAVAGPRARGAAASIEWEGQRYHVDIGGAERRRLDRVRDKLGGATFETVLGVAAHARDLDHSGAALDTVRDASARLATLVTELATGTRDAVHKDVTAAIREAAQALAAIKRPNDRTEPGRAGAQLSAVADALLGEALLSLAYALDLGDPEGTILIAGDPSRRHDFGYGLPSRDARTKAMWSVAFTETRGGPSHLVGSALALDVAMAPLSLRRISSDHVPDAPMLNLMQRDSFAATVALVDPRALTDQDRDEIAARVERGLTRVDAMRSGPGTTETADALAREAGLDGWRARALGWTARHEPARAASLLSMTELLVLGGGSPSAFNPWGMYALRTAGCLCTELAAPRKWRSWWGLSQAGLPAAMAADLPLRVAVVLHNLHLPSALAKPVLAAAMQDFIDGVNPTDGNDWLTLARAAQAVGRERFEDYIAAATADGPLLPDVPETPDR